MIILIYKDNIRKTLLGDHKRGEKMAYTFCDFAEEVFKAVKRPLTVNEAWNLGVELGFAQKVQTSEGSIMHLV
mgnify:CR=1 FL=1